MARKYVPLLAVSALGAAGVAGTFQPLNIRPGLWEITLTVQTAGAPPMPPELLRKLTAEQRARMEASTKSGSDKQTNVKKSCLTAPELQHPLMVGFGDPENCRQNVLTSTATLQEIQVDCGKGLAMGGGTIRIKATDPKNVTVTSEWSGTDSSRTIKMTSSATLKWLGADCGANPAPILAPPAPKSTPPAKPAVSLDDSGNYYTLGKQQAAHSDFRAAVDSFGRALQQHPNDATVFNARGYAYLRLRNFAAAVHDFTEAIRLRPGYRNAYRNRAIARRKAGDAQGAAEDERALAGLNGHL